MVEISAEELAWQEDANCKGTDPAAFFPDDGAPSPAAKRICDRCVVKADCLDYAVTRDIRWGYWGGVNETKRKEMILAYKRRQAAA